MIAVVEEEVSDEAPGFSGEAEEIAEEDAVEEPSELAEILEIESPELEFGTSHLMKTL